MDIPKLIEAISTLTWPTLAAILLWKLFPLVKNLLESRGFTVKVGDMEITVQEASEQLQMQIEDLQKKVSELRSPSAKSEDIVRLESTKTPLESTPRRILWVDDNPANNAYEIARLRNGGIEVIEATSTQDALDILIQQNLTVCAVISDMGRRENGLWHPKAGVALTKQIREHNLNMPVFVYTSSEGLQQRQKDIISAGGNGATASTVELFEMINNIPGL